MSTDEEILAQLTESLEREDELPPESFIPIEVAQDKTVPGSTYPRGRRLQRTTLPWILPTGTAAGYALDDEGRVVGLKLADIRTGRSLNLIAQLQHLRRLVLVGFRDLDIPESFANLKNLNFLWIAGDFRKLPKEILSLNLPINGLSSAGLEPFEQLLSREALEALGKTRDETVHSTQQAQLVFEDLEEELPIGVAREILDLKGIFVAAENLSDPPIEIVRRGRDAIEYYFWGVTADAKPLNEVKVLLVGNGAAGKTSLVKRMLGDRFDAEEAQTHGINIRSWSVATPSKKEVKLNFWDFGGQEIMHATHQFFLSKRSIYLLVLDGRKEEDPEYWLQHIESFGGDSPVIIILNKIDEHPAFEVNRRFLKSKYKGIIDFFRVSCATGVGVSDITGRLVHELESLPMLETLWPGGWFRVKQKLESLDTAYVSLDQYRTICIEEGVVDDKSQNTLVDFLNDLGVVLHFEDIELLDTHVLDPRWVTEAVYRIINSKLLAEQKGFLKLSQLPTVLRPRGKESLKYPADKHRYIVDLMLKFELCYELDSSALLVPDLLDIQEPAVRFDYTDALRFVFEYSYLPRSIMPRFIVRMNKDIQERMSWRTGVILQEKSFSSIALVLADEKDKRIYVFVNGKQRRDYFSVIRKVLNDINSSFEKLGVTELVPLPDRPEVLLDYKELLGFELAQRNEIFVGRLGKAYDVQMLLNGLEKKPVRQSQLSPLILVEGNYFADSVNIGDRFVTQQRQVMNIDNRTGYSVQNWERILVYISAVLFIGVISFLAIRNQPIADPNLVVLIRTVLSIVVAIFGATVPGMLKVDFSAKGLSIRAIGALALFVISFLLTPRVL
jgi:internalin A